MKTLILMRHAKSDWGSGALSDHERPLNDRGIKTAPVMAEFLHRNLGTPSVIVASSAKRAQQTAAFMAAGTRYEAEIITREPLYTGTSQTYLSVIRELHDRIGSALIIGHNPLLEEAVSLLLSGKEHGIRVVMPTAAMVCFSIESATWKSIIQGEAYLRWMKIPKMNED